MSEDNSKKIDRILREPLSQGAFDTMAAASTETFKLTPYVRGRVVPVAGAEGDHG